MNYPPKGVIRHLTKFIVHRVSPRDALWPFWHSLKKIRILAVLVHDVSTRGAAWPCSAPTLLSLHPVILLKSMHLFRKCIHPMYVIFNDAHYLQTLENILQKYKRSCKVLHHRLYKLGLHYIVTSCCAVVLILPFRYTCCVTQVC